MLIPAFAIRDGYWYPDGDIVVSAKQGAPSGYTFTDPRPLNPNNDQWVRRTGQNNPFWELTNDMPAWDVVAYQQRLEGAQTQALADVEFLFDRILALGMRYDFGAAGIAAKANDVRTQGGTVSFESVLEYPHSNISFSVAPDDGFLHIQARLRDRSTLQQTFVFVQQLVDRGVTDPLAFQSTENILIPLSLADYDAVSFALGQWYSAKFYELQIHKLSIRNMTSIQDVVSYQPTFTPN